MVLTTPREFSIRAGQGHAREVISPERVGVSDRLDATAAGDIDIERVRDRAGRDGAIGGPVPVGSSQACCRCLVLGAILSRVTIGDVLGYRHQCLLNEK